jgi:hypothetical protein
MGNAAPKPHHTPEESTMVFDTHPCTPQGAHRVYGHGQHPSVCTINEYADIFGVATDALNFPTLCCFGPPNRAALLQKLQSQYPHLGISLREAFVGRLILVLVITRQQPRQQQQVATTIISGASHTDEEMPSVSPMMSRLPPPIPPPTTTIPIVQAILLDERK